MKYKISNEITYNYQFTPYVLLAVGIACFIGIIKFRLTGEIILELFLTIMFIVLVILFLVSLYWNKYLRIAYLDEEYLYLFKNKKQTRVLLKDICSLDSYWYPTIYEENWIKIQYRGEDNIIEKVLIIPTQLSPDKRFKFNRNIFALLRKRIEQAIEHSQNT